MSELNEEVYTVDLPPHLDSWGMALCYILGLSTEAKAARARWSEQHDAWLKDDSLPRPEDAHIFMDVQSILLRTHPLYMRFVASNAITEGELAGYLMRIVNAMGEAKEALAGVEWMTRKVCFVRGDSAIVSALVRHAVGVLPSTFQIKFTVGPQGAGRC